MTRWDYPYRWGGPVLAWELARGLKRREATILGFLFLALCLIHFSLSAYNLDRQLEAHIAAKELQTSSFSPGTTYKWRDRVEFMNQGKIDFASRYLGRFFPLQLLVLLLITPAVSAGALGQEKEKDTLTALFGTELHDYEIVRGKVLGRFLQLCRFIMVSMPFVFVVAGLGRVHLWDVCICYLHAFVITFAMTGICIFGAVITRRTRDAIMACYSIIIIITLISLTILGDSPIPLWLNPVEMVVRLSAAPFTSVSLPTLGTHLFIFWFLGYFFVKLSCWFIRPACLKQLEDRSYRWRWGIRSNVGENPIRWRERQILGIAPLPALRTIPTWLGALGCLVFSIAMIGGIINNNTQGRLVYHFFKFEWNHFFGIFQRLSPTMVANETILMGVILIFFTGITILVRCAGAISEEKRMKTWEDLLMTAIPVQEIASQKMWGIMQASTLFIVCYSVPLFAFASLGGWDGLTPALICFGITWLVVFIAGNVGMAMSLGSVQYQQNHEKLSYLRNELSKRPFVQEVS